MKNKKVLIGVGVVGALALAYYLYSRKKKSTVTTATGSENGKLAGETSGSGAMPVATPIADTVVDEAGNQTESKEIKVERRPMPVTPPPSTRPPVAAPKPAVMPTAPKPSFSIPVASKPSIGAYSPSSRTISNPLGRSSRFDGGGDYCEIGESLTDLN